MFPWIRIHKNKRWHPLGKHGQEPGSHVILPISADYAEVQ